MFQCSQHRSGRAGTGHKQCFRLGRCSQTGREGHPLVGLALRCSIGLLHKQGKKAKRAHPRPSITTTATPGKNRDLFERRVRRQGQAALEEVHGAHKPRSARPTEPTTQTHLGCKDCTQHEGWTRQGSRSQLGTQPHWRQGKQRHSTAPQSWDCRRNTWSSLAQMRRYQGCAWAVAERGHTGCIQQYHRCMFPAIEQTRSLRTQRAWPQRGPVSVAALIWTEIGYAVASAKPKEHARRRAAVGAPAQRAVGAPAQRAVGAPAQRRSSTCTADNRCWCRW
jgi:hypothetical protein